MQLLRNLNPGIHYARTTLESSNVAYFSLRDSAIRKNCHAYKCLQSHYIAGCVSFTLVSFFFFHFCVLRNSTCVIGWFWSNRTCVHRVTQIAKDLPLPPQPPFCWTDFFFCLIIIKSFFLSHLYAHLTLTATRVTIHPDLPHLAAVLSAHHHLYK